MMENFSIFHWLFLVLFIILLLFFDLLLWCLYKAAHGDLKTSGSDVQREWESWAQRSFGPDPNRVSIALAAIPIAIEKFDHAEDIEKFIAGAVHLYDSLKS